MHVYIEREVISCFFGVEYGKRATPVGRYSNNDTTTTTTTTNHSSNTHNAHNHNNYNTTTTTNNNDTSNNNTYTNAKSNVCDSCGQVRRGGLQLAHAALADLIRSISEI